jgi:Mg-chelatase subunit ChlD
MHRVIYDVPKWHVVQHRRERSLPMPDDFDAPGQAIGDELFDRLYSGDAELLDPKEITSRLKDWAFAVHQTAEQNPRWQRIIDAVRGDAILAAAATEAFVGELGIPGAPEEEGAPPVPDARAMRQRVHHGCSRANAAVADAQDVKDGLSGIGWDLSECAAAPGDPQRARWAFNRVRHNERLKRIALLAGKFKRLSAHKRKSRVKHAADEVQDIELGGEISRLIPSELAKLCHPVARLALLRDILERQAMQYRLSGSEAQGKGPMVVCLDKSGSMTGNDEEKDIWATAVALALLEKAQAERRPFHLVAFNGRIVAEFEVAPGHSLHQDALFIHPAGGTNIVRALSRALEIIGSQPSMRKADIVLVSDGVSELAPAPELRRMALERGVTILGVGIRIPEGALSCWCDEHMVINDLDTIEDRAADALFGQ